MSAMSATILNNFTENYIFEQIELSDGRIGYYVLSPDCEYYTFQTNSARYEISFKYTGANPITYKFHDYVKEIMNSIVFLDTTSAEELPTIRAVGAYESGGYISFTVTTAPGNFSRLRCGLSKTTVDNIAIANQYTVKPNGDYVWTIKIAKPADGTTLYFDLRDADTLKYIKEYYVYGYRA